MRPTVKRWQFVALVAGMSAWWWGCEAGAPNPQAVVSRAALQAFSGEGACKDLETYLEDTAVMQMRTQLEAQRDGVPSWGWWGGGPFLDDRAENAAGAPVPSAAKKAPTDYTTTNNQVAGVDEADFVKNDGTRIFALSGETLHAVKSWPAEETQVLGTLKIDGYPRELFLEGTSKAVVFSTIYQPYPLSHGRGAECAGLTCGYSSANTVKATVVDVSDMANMKVIAEYSLPGSYNSARKVGSSVRVVMSDTFNFPDGFKMYPDYDPVLWNDKARMRRAYNALMDANEKLIRQLTLAEWVPDATIVVGGNARAVPLACTDFAKVNAPTRLGTVSVVTLNLETATLGRTSVIAEPGEVYASAKNLYVATRHWWWWPAPGQKDTTYVHKFDISEPDAAHYVASGTVDGHIVDQFSMDEAASGHFRMVTTIGTRIAEPFNEWGRIETTNRLSVLGENEGFLEVVGQSEELAKGERVMSSRIIGDRGFVVTFRQVDPLFTFDLSDPAHPRKVGELKVPGFSTYLHPIDDNHLLTIGTYVPEPEPGQPQNWQAQALQLAIFDVSDMANPRQTHTQLVGLAYGWSEAQYEHKAFNYFPAKKLLAIPFADWSSGQVGESYWSSFSSELKVYGVDAQTGFVAKGAISMDDLYQEQHYATWSYYWTPQVRRSVMADDFVYAISDAGIRVANMSNLSAPLATAKFARYVER